MQQILRLDKYDRDTVRGLYIIQINNDDYANNILKDDGTVDSFWVEKRVSVISVLNEDSNKFCLIGIYYNHSELIDFDELVELVNDTSGDRHYRMMSVAEITAVMKFRLGKIEEHGDGERAYEIKREKSRNAIAKKHV